MIRRVLLERVDEPTHQRVPVPYRNALDSQSRFLADQCDNFHTVCSTEVYYWGSFSGYQEDKACEDSSILWQEWFLFYRSFLEKDEWGGLEAVLLSDGWAPRWEDCMRLCWIACWDLCRALISWERVVDSGWKDVRTNLSDGEGNQNVLMTRLPSAEERSRLPPIIN